MKRVLAVIILFLITLFQSPFLFVHAEGFDFKSELFKGVSSQFMCTCGCGQDHYECDPNTCNLTKEFKKDLVEMINEGMTKQEIREYYVKEYGEEILTSPEKKGFSLTAWVLPFVAIGGAGTTVFFVIRKWVGRKSAIIEVDESSEVPDGVEKEILTSMIDEERKKYL